MQLLDRKNNEPMSCLLFFDSWKARRQMMVRRQIMVRNNVIMWLNAEWKRHGKSKVNQQPFSTDEFRVLTPKGKCDLLLQGLADCNISGLTLPVRQSRAKITPGIAESLLVTTLTLYISSANEFSQTSSSSSYLEIRSG
jgi:hypothetical protein